MVHIGGKALRPFPVIDLRRLSTFEASNHSQRITRPVKRQTLRAGSTAPPNRTLRFFLLSIFAFWLRSVHINRLEFSENDRPSFCIRGILRFQSRPGEDLKSSFCQERVATRHPADELSPSSGYSFLADFKSYYCGRYPHSLRASVYVGNCVSGYGGSY